MKLSYYKNFDCVGQKSVIFLKKVLSEVSDEPNHIYLLLGFKNFCL